MRKRAPHQLLAALVLLAVLTPACKKQPREAPRATVAMPPLFMPPPLEPAPTPAEISGPVGIMGGPFVGFGMRLQSTTNAVAIEQVFPDSPASEADLRADDVIVAIDGVSTLGLSVRDVMARLRGAAGTEALVNLERGIDAIQVRMVRRPLPQVPLPGTGP